MAIAMNDKAKIYEKSGYKKTYNAKEGFGDSGLLDWRAGITEYKESEFVWHDKINYF